MTLTFPLYSFLFDEWISGTTPRGDTGGGQSSACKHEGQWKPASPQLDVCQDPSCWARRQGGSHVIWSSCFVQTLFLFSCLTIKDLWSNIKWWLWRLSASKCLSNMFVQSFLGLSVFLSPPPQGNLNISWNGAMLTQLCWRSTEEFLISSHSRHLNLSTVCFFSYSDENSNLHFTAWF